MTPARRPGAEVGDAPWPRLFIESLRLDREPLEAVRRHARAAIEAGVGGFILFGGEVGTVRELCTELRRGARWPLWLAADLERGAGQQFAGATELPPPRALATHPQAEHAVRTAAALTAREAGELGLNWVFAPVLDLDVEPRNPIVGTRSFGADPAAVTILGLAWVEACQAEGVAACAKHFPGHGRTTADSHLELPVVGASGDDLEADLRPFRAVAGTAASFMTAHVAYPSLGADGAATFSPAVLTELLRGELDFQGLVVSDALIMEGFRASAGGGREDGVTSADGVGRAVRDRAEPEGAPESGEAFAAARALAAGCDLLLYPEDLEGTVTGLAAGANDGLAARAGEAVRRSEAALRRFPGQPAADSGTVSSLRVSLPETFPDRARLAGELAVGCLRPAGAVERLAWQRDAGTELLWTSDDPADEGCPPGRALAEELRALGWRISAARPLGHADGPRGAQRLVLVRSTPRAWKGRSGLPSSVTEATRAAVAEASRAAAVALAHERVLEELAVPGICAWAGEAVMERAVARWLDARAS